MKKIKIFLIIAIALLIVIAGSLTANTIITKKVGEGENYYKKIASSSKRDVWEYDSQQALESYSSNKSGGNVNQIISMTSNDYEMESSSTIQSSSTKYTDILGYSTSSENYIGYSVGGANNINNFRENIKEGYLPLLTDITYNGIYSEYYFDTGEVDRSSNEMFYPSYSMAVSTNPITSEKEYYMSVGLNSNIKESDFNRKKINIVIVLDISGSMSSSFSSYYYDNPYKQYGKNKTKMKVAEKCVNHLIDKLNPDDRIGIVLFDNQAYLGCKIVEIGDTDTDALKSHILEVEPQGSTNFSSGYEMGTELFTTEILDEDYQNRIIVITDAMPNLGVTSTDGLVQKIKANSNKKIYTSFIGVGVDFNTEYTEGVSDVRGFNYYSVHNGEEFKKILADEFDYMVTPLVYDLDLTLKSNNYAIENVYGSDSVNKLTGNIMHVNTLFPSSSNENGEVKGGIIVLKLKKLHKADGGDIELNVSYKDTSEMSHHNNKKVSFKDSKDDYYDNLGIRKAIVLARYVGTMKNWVTYERTKNEEFEASKRYNLTDYSYDDEYVKNVLGADERTSVKLSVSDDYKATFKRLKSYIEQENKELDDKDLNNEIELINLLI